MGNPIVSIIIPAYNTADVICRTLKSIEEQTYPYYEIVIVNDGSSDSTQKLLDDYQRGKTNVVVYHQENQGVSAARNKGIELAKGEFICFLDSDDTYEPDFLALMTKKQQEQKANLIYCGYNRIGVDDKKSPGNVKYYNGNLVEHFFQKTRHLPYLFHLSCMLVRKSLLVEYNIRFEVGRTISEDVSFIVKVIAVSDGYSVEKNLYNYFYRENSAVNLKYLANIESDIAGWNNMQNFVKNLDSNVFNTYHALEYIEKHTVKIILSLFKYLFKTFNYTKIKEIIKNQNLKARVKNINLSNFSSTEKAIVNSIESENLFRWILLSIYYRVFKINLNSIKKFIKKRKQQS